MAAPYAFDAAIGAIYEAGLDAARIPESLAAIARAADAWGCAQWSVDPTNGIVHYMHAHGHTAEAQLAYSQYYHRIDPGVILNLACPVGEWVLDRQCLDPRQPSQREYIDDFCRPFDIAWVAGASLLASRHRRVLFGMQRASTQGAFSPDRVPLLDRLMRHLRSSSVIQERLHDALSGRKLLVEALDALRVAVCVANVLGHVRYANRAAEDMLIRCHSLRFRENRLIGSTQWNDSQVRKGLAQACGHPPAAFGLRLPDADPHGLQLIFSPLGDRHDLKGQDLRTTEPLALVLLGTLPRSVATIDRLKQMFGLTPAEARVVQALAAGEDLMSLSKRVQVSISTLRTQLSAALTKTGTDSQTPLIALVKSLPATGPAGMSVNSRTERMVP